MDKIKEFLIATDREISSGYTVADISVERDENGLLCCANTPDGSPVVAHYLDLNIDCEALRAGLLCSMALLRILTEGMEQATAMLEERRAAREAKKQASQEDQGQ